MQFGLEAGIAAGVVAATLYFAVGYAQSQLSAFTLAPGRSRIVRAADQEAALELLRPAHLVSAQVGQLPSGLLLCCFCSHAIGLMGSPVLCSGPAAPSTPPGSHPLARPCLLQLRGFLFFGVANAISVRVHEAAQCLASGLSSEACGVGGSSPVAGGAWGRLQSQQARQADRLYAGSSKHDGALFASAAAPRFLLLDLSRWV